VNVRLIDRSDDGNSWLIYSDGPQDLGTYYLYNHQSPFTELDHLATQRHQSARCCRRSTSIEVHDL
jgi:hypothetical protein